MVLSTPPSDNRYKVVNAEYSWDRFVGWVNDSTNQQKWKNLKPTEAKRPMQVISGVMIGVTTWMFFWWQLRQSSDSYLRPAYWESEIAKLKKLEQHNQQQRSHHH